MKLDLKTLKHVQFVFGLHSDKSCQTNGYRSLLKLIEEAEKQLRLTDTVGQIEGLKPFHCPNCGEYWDTQKFNSCQCGASIKK